MENKQSNNPVLKYVVPVLLAFLGKKGIFYYFSFEYSLFSDAFSFANLMIDVGVFVALFIIARFVVDYFVANKQQSDTVVVEQDVKPS